MGRILLKIFLALTVYKPIPSSIHTIILVVCGFGVQIEHFSLIFDLFSSPPQCYYVVIYDVCSYLLPSAFCMKFLCRNSF